MGQIETLALPASLQRPAIWARPTTKEELMRDYGLSYWYERRIPKPWDTERFKWAPGTLIATIPSVVATGVAPSGPTRTIFPQGAFPLVSAARARIRALMR